jgi:hypothetical protein
VQSLVEEKQDINNGSSLLGALKATRIDGVTGELRLEPETGDRKYLFDLLSIQCNRSSVGCTEFDTVTVLSQSDKSTDNTFIKVADIRWPAGFGSTIPDDGSLLEPSKCLLIILGDNFEVGQTLDLQIDVANNFGEALPEAHCLILSMTKASDSTVLSTADIMVPANSTTIAVRYVLQGAPGAYEISAFDKRTGYHIQNSPSIVIVITVQEGLSSNWILVGSGNAAFVIVCGFVVLVRKRHAQLQSILVMLLNEVTMPIHLHPHTPDP